MNDLPSEPGSRPGWWSRFCTKLRAWLATASDEPAHGPKTILAAVREPAVGSLVAVNLRRQGYRVDVVGTCEEALARLEQEPPDMLVLDLGLTDADPLELVREIRRGEGGSYFPIIGLVPKPGPGVAALRRACLSSWLPMPFNPMELTAFVKRHFGHLADERRGVWHEKFTV